MVLRFEGTRRPGLDWDAVGMGGGGNAACCCCCCLLLRLLLLSGGAFAVWLGLLPLKESMPECLGWCAILLFSC